MKLENIRSSLQVPEEMHKRKFTPEEIQEQYQENLEAFGEVMQGVEDGEYTPDTYIAEDGNYRVRVRNANGDILFDDLFDDYMGINEELGFGYTEIEKTQMMADAYEKKQQQG